MWSMHYISIGLWLLLAFVSTTSGLCTRYTLPKGVWSCNNTVTITLYHSGIISSIDFGQVFPGCILVGGFQVVDTTQVNTYTGFTCQDSTACAANPSLNCSAIARTAVDTNFAWVDDECHDFTALGGGFVPIECTWSQLSCL